MTLDPIADIFRKIGLPPRYRQHQKRTRSVSLSDTAYLGLNKLAAENHMNTWRGGNVSALMEAIGLGVFRVERKEAWEIEAEESNGL